LSYENDDILQALQLLISHRPDLRAPIGEIVQMEPSRRYIGVISAFYEQKHFGFIKSDEANAEFGTDTFLSDKELGPFTVGSTVMFSIATNKDGKPQARLLEAAELEEAFVPTPAASRNHAPMPLKRPRVAIEPQPDWSAICAVVPQGPPLKMPRQSGKGGGSIGSSMGSPFGGQDGHIALNLLGNPAGPASKGASWGSPAGDTRYTGVISSFYPQRKFGFIKSDQVFLEYGIDTFLSDKELGAFGVDSHVSFQLAVNAQGKPQARDLQDADEQDPLTARYAGCIHHFDPDRKYGFLDCDAAKQLFGMDTFLSNREIGNFTNGDMVSFSISLSKQGKPQAHGLAGGNM